MTYKRGDVVIIKFPFTDASEYKKRPALIISNDTVNKTGDFMMLQITSKVKNDSLSLPILKNNFVNEKELPLASSLRVHKIFLLNQSLIISKATEVNIDFLNAVIDKFNALIK